MRPAQRRPVATRVRRLLRRVGIPLAAVTAIAGCATPPDPSASRVRTAAANAAVGLDARLTPLMRQHEVIADWSADYCIEGQHNWKIDTPYDWNCYASRNVAIRVDGLRPGAEAIDAELTRLGCHPEGNAQRMGLAVMLDHYEKQDPPHRLPDVNFRCGQDMVFVKPSDRTDERHAGSLERPNGWPQQATGSAGTRMLGGGAISPEEAERLRSTDGVFMLVTATRNYHRE